MRVLSTGHMQDDLLGAFAHSIWAYTASRDIQLNIHILLGLKMFWWKHFHVVSLRGVLPYILLNIRTNVGIKLMAIISVQSFLFNFRLIFGYNTLTIYFSEGSSWP